MNPERSLTRASGELSGSGLQWWKSQTLIDTIFATVASACETEEERQLFVARCRTEGYNPLAGELYAIKRPERQEDGSYKKKLYFVSSYHKFVERAKQGGYHLHGAAVCAKDIFEGMDAVTGLPIKHLTAKGERGMPTGAWARAVHVNNPTLVTFVYIEFNSVAQRKKDGGLAGKWAAEPQWMILKTALARAARMAVPTLGSVYLAEELGRSESEIAQTLSIPELRKAAVIASRPLEPEPAEEPKATESAPKPEPKPAPSTHERLNILVKSEDPLVSKIANRHLKDVIAQTGVKRIRDLDETLAQQVVLSILSDIENSKEPA